MNEQARISNAVALAGQYGQIGGDHHKMWVIDQMIRILLGDQYDAWFAEANTEDYPWDQGIAP